jgi:hypothetical protein
VLCSSLTYVQALPHVLEGEQIQQYTSVYSPPFDEFEVYKIHLPAEASTLVPANQVSPFAATPVPALLPNLRAGFRRCRLQ